MPQFSGYTELAHPVAEIFAFFLAPANLVRLKPPTVDLTLVDAPACLHLGARTTWKLRRWGVARTLVLEVTELEENAKLVEQQIQGPFRAWLHTRRFEPTDGGSRLTEEILFEPPGGLLGRLATEERILLELRENFAHQQSLFRNSLEQRF